MTKYGVIKYDKMIVWLLLNDNRINEWFWSNK